MKMPQLMDGAWSTPNARRLLVVSIIDSTGNGAFTAASVVLFSTVLSLTPTQIGQGLAVGALIGLGTSVLWGAVADRLGVRSVLLCLQLWRATAFIGYAFIDDFAGFLAIVIFLGLAERASPPILLSFLAQAIGEQDRVKTAGALRSIRNAGFTLGALLSSLALLSPGRTSMLVVVLGNAASFIIAAALLRRIQLLGPAKPVRKPKGAGRDRVLRRPAFLATTALTGLMSVHRQVLAVGLPLWILSGGLAPQALVSVLIAGNAVLVVLLQVRLTRGADDARGAGRALLNAGVMMMACTGLFALTTSDTALPTLLVIALLVAATLALTLAEMWHAAGAWGLSLLLSPEASRSRFLSVFNLGSSALDVSGALILTALVLPAGQAGWLVLGAVLLVTGLAMPSVSRWAEHERLRHEEEAGDEASPVEQLKRS